jgi:hypothetical protein
MSENLKLPNELMTLDEVVNSLNEEQQLYRLNSLLEIFIRRKMDLLKKRDNLLKKNNKIEEEIMELVSPEDSEKEEENQENAEDFVLYYGFNVVDFQRQIETNKIEIDSINYQMRRLQEKIDELKEEKSNMKN